MFGVIPNTDLRLISSPLPLCLSSQTRTPPPNLFSVSPTHIHAMASANQLRLVSCCGWNLDVNLLRKYPLPLIYVCYKNTGYLLVNSSFLTFSTFSSLGIGGMDDEVLIRGHPFGGYEITYRKALVSSIQANKPNTKRV